MVNLVVNESETEYVPFPSNSLTLQVLGMEESHFGSDDAGRKEIINLTFPIKNWEADQGPKCGSYVIPFSFILPGWLPESMMMAEPEGKFLLQVKYRLTA